MTRFTAVVEVGAPVDDVWARLVDWPSHSRWVPFTRVEVLTPRPDGVGARFVGRTGVGPLAFDDPMEVTAWLPPTATTPGRCELRKLGRVVLGRASFDVAAVGERRSLVVWDEDVEVAPVALTRPFGALIAAAGRRAFAGTIRAMGREAEAAARERDLAAGAAAA